MNILTMDWNKGGAGGMAMSGIFFRISVDITFDDDFLS
jgi:hypothetical protein